MHSRFTYRVVDGKRCLILDAPMPPTLNQVRSAYIGFIYESTGFNKTKAATILQMGVRTLQRWAKREGWQ